MKRKIKKFRTVVNHLLRIPRTRGFGVQSPTAYSFLRKVVNEQCFLSSFSEASWGVSYPKVASRRERFLYRLRCSYPQVKVLDVDEWANPNDVDSILANCSSNAVLALLDLNRDKVSMKSWDKIIANKRCVLTFDLLDCGVIFFDKTKFKQHFKVNY